MAEVYPAGPAVLDSLPKTAFIVRTWDCVWPPGECGRQRGRIAESRPAGAPGWRSGTGSALQPQGWVVAPGEARAHLAVNAGCTPHHPSPSNSGSPGIPKSRLQPSAPVLQSLEQAPAGLRIKGQHSGLAAKGLCAPGPAPHQLPLRPPPKCLGSSPTALFQF